MSLTAIPKIPRLRKEAKPLKKCRDTGLLTVGDATPTVTSEEQRGGSIRLTSSRASMLVSIRGLFEMYQFTLSQQQHRALMCTAATTEQQHPDKTTLKGLSAAAFACVTLLTDRCSFYIILTIS